MAADDKQDSEHLPRMIETLQAGNAAPAAWTKAADDEAACVQTCFQKVENQLDRFRVEEFWDCVMRESPRA